MECLFCKLLATHGIRYEYIYEGREVHAVVCNACVAKRMLRIKLQALPKIALLAAAAGLLIYLILPEITRPQPLYGRIFFLVILVWIGFYPLAGIISVIGLAFNPIEAIAPHVHANLLKNGFPALDSDHRSAEWFGEPTKRDPARRAWDLGKTGDEKALPELIKLSASRSVEVRHAAISSLEQFWWTADTEAIRRLTQTLCDPDARVRGISALALGEYLKKYAETSDSTTSVGTTLRGEAKSHLLASLSDPVDDVVAQAVTALANIDDEDVVSRMAQAVHHRGFGEQAIKIVNTLRPTKTRRAMITEIEGLL